MKDILFKFSQGVLIFSTFVKKERKKGSGNEKRRERARMRIVCWKMRQSGYYYWRWGVFVVSAHCGWSKLNKKLTSGHQSIQTSFTAPFLKGQLHLSKSLSFKGFHFSPVSMLKLFIIFFLCFCVIIDHNWVQLKHN